jgi:hypothetical protein
MTQQKALQDCIDSMLKVACMAEALKRECGMDPESAQAIRNSEYMNISYAARDAITQAKQALAEVQGEAVIKLIPSAEELGTPQASEPLPSNHIAQSSELVPLSSEPAGWTGKTDIDAALIMLDRLDVRGEGDDARADGIAQTLRNLTAAPEAK